MSAIVAGMGTGWSSVASAVTGTVSFTSVRSGEWEVWSASSDGSAEQRVAAGMAPVYSPDGRQIVYVCANFQLCVMNADGSGQSMLTRTRWPRRFDYHLNPAWSADGRRIAFARRHGGRSHIYVVRRDGSGLRRLTRGRQLDDAPTWSPDGRRIAFTRTRSASTIVVMTTNGRGVRPVTRDGADSTNPAWSPDGRTIVFTREEGGLTHLYTITPGGGRLRALTTGPWSDDDAAWSPDGTRIAFASDRENLARVWVMNADGRAPMPISGASGGDVEPSWQPQTAGHPVPPGRARPPRATADARVVGVLRGWMTQITADFAGPLPSRDNPARLERLARALSTHDDAARAVLFRVRPRSTRGRHIERVLVRATRHADTVGSELQAAAQAAQHADGPLTGTHALAAREAMLRLSAAIVRLADEAGPGTAGPPATAVPARADAVPARIAEIQGALCAPGYPQHCGSAVVTGRTYRHWARVARRAGGADVRQHVMEFLISTWWVEGEAAQRDIFITPLRMVQRFLKLRAQSFASVREYRDFLRSSGMTETDLMMRVRTNLLSDAIREQVGDQDRFVEEFRARWRAATRCHPRFQIDECGGTLSQAGASAVRAARKDRRPRGRRQA